MKLAELKVGMKVKIKTANQLCEEFNKIKVSHILNFNRAGYMNKWCGRTVIIHKIYRSDIIHVQDDIDNWAWDIRVFIPVKKKLNFKGLQ